MENKMTKDINHVELVDAENMQLWKFQVTIILKSHDLYKHVTEKTPRENRTEALEKKDANAQKVLVNNYRSTTVDLKCR